MIVREAPRSFRRAPELSELIRWVDNENIPLVRPSEGSCIDLDLSRDMNGSQYRRDGRSTFEFGLDEIWLGSMWTAPSRFQVPLISEERRVYLRERLEAAGRLWVDVEA